jgi:hypothetical protein
MNQKPKKRKKLLVERIVDHAALNKVLHGIAALLPSSLRGWLQRTKWKIKLKFGKRLVSVDGLSQIQRNAWMWLIQEVGRENVGDYLEFGVFNGTSLHCMHSNLAELGLNHVRLFGFDSWEGLPPNCGGAEDGYHWTPGYFQMDYDYCRRWLDERGVDWNRVFLIKGWFNQTCTPELVAVHAIKKASVIMIDSDTYSSARDALTFCSELIRDKAVILFDDWGMKGDKPIGEELAFREFLETHPEFTAEDMGKYDATSRVFKVQRRNVVPRRSERVPAEVSA